MRAKRKLQSIREGFERKVRQIKEGLKLLTIEHADLKKLQRERIKGRLETILKTGGTESRNEGWEGEGENESTLERPR